MAIVDEILLACSTRELGAIFTHDVLVNCGWRDIAEGPHVEVVARIRRTFIHEDGHRIASTGIIAVISPVRGMSIIMDVRAAFTSQFDDDARSAT